jgi:aldehyde dehydrogenase (NAD+)
MSLLRDRQFIGGEFRSAETLEQIINPATELEIGQAPVGTLLDANAAVDAAHQAFRGGKWRLMSALERVAAMRRFYDFLDQRVEEICALIVAEAGATIGLTRGAQWALPMKHFRVSLWGGTPPTFSRILASATDSLDSL